MDLQTENMIKDAVLYKSNYTDNWYICWIYESYRYLLTIDNTFTKEFTPIKFKYELDAKTYLAVLIDNCK